MAMRHGESLKRPQRPAAHQQDSAAGRRTMARPSLIAVPMKSPAPVAPTPVTTARTVGSEAHSRYSTPSAITQMKGSAIRPRNATIAPVTPNQRLPSTIEALPIFGPGRNWHRPMVSAKSACVSQRRSSTIVRCAHGITPPNERAPMARKPVNKSVSERGGATSIFSWTIHHMRAWLVPLVLCIAVQAHAAGPASLVFSELEKVRILSLGPWPPQMPRDPRNRVSGKREAIAFGERLFFEPRLSGTGSVLCATCHAPFRSFQDARPHAFGLEQVERNTPTLLNVAFYRRYGWDGGRENLWSQSIRPLLEPREMGSSAAHVASFVRRQLAADYGKSSMRRRRRTMRRCWRTWARRSPPTRKRYSPAAR